MSIENIYKKGVTTDNGYKNLLFLNTEGVYKDFKKLNLYLNNKILNYEFDGNNLVVENYNLVEGNNIFYLENNGIFSFVYNLPIIKNKPYISNIENKGLEGDYRLFDIHFGNFNHDKDSFYLNNIKISSVSCTNTKCVVKAPINTLKGDFYLINELGTISEPFKMDIRDVSLPIINYVTFSSNNLITGTVFKIIGEGFDGGIITFDNLLNKDKHGRYNISNSNNAIEGKLPNFFDNTKQFNIKISKNGYTSSISFKQSDLINGSINGKGIILNVQELGGNNIIESGNEISIFGKGFHKTDKIFIGDYQLEFNYINSHKIDIIIDKLFKKGFHELYLVNNNGIKSDIFILNILEDNFELKLFDTGNNIGFSTFEKIKNSLYSIRFENLYKNLFFKSIYFNINKLDNDAINNGSYKLLINGVNFGLSSVDKSGKIKFDDIYIGDLGEQVIIELYKDSVFTNGGKYSIKLDELNIYSSEIKGILNNINYSYLNGIYFDVKDNELDNCISFGNNGINYCLVNKSSNLKENQIINNEDDGKNIKNNNNDKTLVNKSKLVYDRIDKIINGIIIKQNDFSFFKQLNYYKNLKNKVNIITNKKPNSNVRIYLEYFYDRLNKEYLTVFKSYVLSKK